MRPQDQPRDLSPGVVAGRRRRLTTSELLCDERAASLARLADRCEGLALVCDATRRPAEAGAARNIRDDLRAIAAAEGPGVHNDLSALLS